MHCPRTARDEPERDKHKMSDFSSKALAFIESALDDGKTVYITTATRCTPISPKCAAKWKASGAQLFKITADGLRIARGKSFDLITTPHASLCKISAQ